MLGIINIDTIEKRLLLEKELNLTPFLAEALSFPIFIRKDIDKLYAENKYTYYEHAKKSEFYDCPISLELSLIREEYYKKIIGLLEYSQAASEADSIGSDIFSLFKKGFKKTYLYFKNIDMVDFKDYMRSQCKHLEKISDDEINANACAALFFAINLVPDESIANADIVYSTFIMRWQHSLGERRISLNNLTNEDEVKIKKLKSTLPKNILNYILMAEPTSAFDYLYDFERLSYLSLIQDLDLGEKDLKEILYVYNMINEQVQMNVSLMDYTIPALHIKMLIKAYKKVKEMYFLNNKETMFVEFGNLEHELKKKKMELYTEQAKYVELKNSENNYIKSLQEENKLLNKKIQQLSNQINQMNSDSNEVIALRNFIFTLEQDDIVSDDTSTSYSEELNKLKGVIIGGHPNWQNKMKESLDWTFISPDFSINEDLIKNADVVIFNVSYLNHSLYYKAIDIIRENSIQMCYIKSTNIQYAICEIYNFMFQ